VDKRLTKNPLIRGIISLKQGLSRNEREETRGGGESSESLPKNTFRSNSRKETQKIPDQPLERKVRFSQPFGQN